MPKASVHKGLRRLQSCLQSVYKVDFVVIFRCFAAPISRRRTFDTGLTVPGALPKKCSETALFSNKCSISIVHQKFRFVKSPERVVIRWFLNKADLIRSHGDTNAGGENNAEFVMRNA